MLEQPWVNSLRRVVSSDETKAKETASLLASRIGVEVDVAPSSGEIDRSATGFVPHERHEELADQLFSFPHQSAEGWERAIDAQARVVTALADLFVETQNGRGDVAVVGHGAVGTLLMCHLAGLDIDRRHDQPGSGYYWTYDLAACELVHGWLPIDGPT